MLTPTILRCARSRWQLAGGFAKAVAAAPEPVPGQDWVLSCDFAEEGHMVVSSSRRLFVMPPIGPSHLPALASRRVRFSPRAR